MINQSIGGIRRFMLSDERIKSVIVLSPRNFYEGYFSR